jgi:hypothetical protein
MTPEEAAKKITEAVQALESGTHEESKAAFEFLRAVPEEYRVALDAFRSALKSSSADARMEAAAALAKLGRGEAWVLPALEEAYVGEENEFVRGRLAFSIASIKTPQAANALVGLLDQELQVEEATFAVGAFCGALASLGELAVQELPEIERLIEFCKEQTARAAGTVYEQGRALALDSLQRAHSKLVHDIMSSYFSFTRQSSVGPSGRPLLGHDTFQLNRTAQQFGNLALVSDTRVDYLADMRPYELSHALDESQRASLKSAGRLREVRCLLFEREPNTFVCIAVWDHFSSTSLMNKFESFARGVINSIPADHNLPVRIEFGIFQPVSEDALDGAYTGVKLISNDDSLEVTNWLPASRFEQVFGQHAHQVWALLRKPPSTPEGFMEFIKGKVQDQVVEKNLEQKRKNLPEGRLDYSALKTQFCDEVAEVICTGENSITEPKLICGDSFDPQGNEEFFGRALPPEIQEIMSQCQAVAEEAAQRGDKNTTDLEWPDLAQIPAELIVRVPRPFEIEVQDGIGQVTLALDPAKYGAIFFRCQNEGLTVHVTNIPFSVFEFSESFSWGYRGTAPFITGKNVLNAFVPPESDGEPAIEKITTYWGIRKQTFASHTANDLAPEFYEQMFVKLPAWGGYISAQRMKQWILAAIARRGGG